MQVKKIFNKLFIASLVACGFSNGVFASGVMPTQVQLQNDNWQFEITPYLWMSGLAGYTQVGKGPTTDVEAMPSDILKCFDLGFMGAFEARKNRFGILADAIYVKLSNTFPTNFPAVNTDAKITEQFYSLAGSYRVTNEDYLPLDFLAGARYMDLKININIDPVPVFPHGFGADNTINWWDGFVGTRLQYALTEKWKLVGYADIGTGGSKLSWQALAGVSYAFNKTFVGKLGYRILSEYYNKDKIVYNMRQGGFSLGLGIRF